MSYSFLDWDPYLDLFIAEDAGGPDEFRELCENESAGCPESPLHYKVSPPKPIQKAKLLPRPKWPPKGTPRPSHKTFMKHLAPREVLVENTFKAHKRTGTHYLYTRFWLRPRDDLDPDLLVSPQFVCRIWIASSGKPRPAWIDHERHTPFSVATYLICALEIELRKCQDTYADMPAWAKAILPPSVPQDDVSGVIWEAKTPPTSPRRAQVMPARTFFDLPPPLDVLHSMNYFFFILLLLMAALPLACKPSCGRTFSSDRDLNIHLNKCGFFKEAQAIRDQKEIHAEDGLAWWKRKRMRLEEKVAQPEQSTSSVLEVPDFEMGAPSTPPQPPSPKPERPPTPPVERTPPGRPVRTKQKTWKLLQQLPEPAPAIVLTPPVADPEPDPLPEPESASSWVWEAVCTTVKDDPATKDFLPKLQEHLLSRLGHPEWSGDGNEFTPAQRYQLQLKNSCMYVHKLLRLNYTTYDVQLRQDCLNPRTHSDVMCLSPEDDDTHPFSYAQIIGIFHADVVNTAPGSDPSPKSMEFLWVRRYKLDTTWRAGFKCKCLHRVAFLPASDPQAFGFLNPDEIIRGSHLVPAFAHGRTEELLAHDSIGRLPRDGLTKLQDWQYYYVNFFVDRDMYMRYRGGGVGHYRVHIPPEDDVPPADGEEDNTPVAAEDPIVVDVITPPRTPDIDDVPLPPQRPASSLSMNSTSSGSSGHSGSTGAGSNVGSGDELDDGDFGPEDGDGDFKEEVEEGYAPL
ncbi:hypothetical protein K438DRAFT_2008466 [Mycena galopus ATCC 62051]|nr:hypothetical protein K438DRAFT_2008466 [Mycena galopus ATCC 62051]